MRWWHILLGWLAVVVGVMTLTAVGCQRPIVDVSRAPASGPMVVHGQLAADVTAVAPSGASGAAWEAWVKQKSPHGVTQLACADRDASHLSLADGGKALRVDETFFTWESPEGIWPGPAIDVRPRPGHPAMMPPAFAKKCPPMGDNPGPYVEVVVPAGADVFVSGCREADRLIPCHDGADSISSTAPLPILGARRRHAWGPAMLAVALASVAAMGAWLFVRGKTA
jgi:hypothetical protein